LGCFENEGIFLNAAHGKEVASHFT